MDAGQPSLDMKLTLREKRLRSRRIHSIAQELAPAKHANANSIIATKAGSDYDEGLSREPVVRIDLDVEKKFAAKISIQFRPWPQLSNSTLQSHKADSDNLTASRSPLHPRSILVDP